MEIARYQLQLPGGPDFRPAASPIEGALVRLAGGYGCLQPWPDLGDAPLDGQLSALREGRPTDMGLACLACCELDGAARREGRSLFEGLRLPRSHHLVANGLDDLPRAAEVGLVKLKGDAHLEQFAEVARLRIDFNASLDAEAFRRFAAGLSASVRERIDFIEDPIPYEATLWSQLEAETGLRLALDRGPLDASEGFSVRVWKPAITPDPPTGERFCITHNLDHEIGRRYAAYRAATFKGKLTECGLGELSPLDGVGLGCADVLESMTWETL